MGDDPLDELVQAGSPLLDELCRGRGGAVKNGAFEPDPIRSGRARAPTLTGFEVVAKYPLGWNLQVHGGKLFP